MVFLQYRREEKEMNVALLNDYEIDIEFLAMDIEEKGYKRNEVIKQLNDRYRRFSQKGDFRCVCCDERVDMVLANDRAFYFRHFDKERCSYSENHKTYTRQKESYEDAPKHRAGKAILRTYLEGICKINNIRLTDGYRFKSTLSYVPDLILEFADGKKWAIDYLTGIKNDRKYANSLNKRRSTYINHHFTPIFLFDSYWLAYEPEINHISLVDGELLCVSQTKEDQLWTEFIKGFEPPLKNTLINERPFSIQVKSMAYFAPHNREISIIRFLQEEDNPKKTRTLYHPIKIPLDQALTITNERTDFTYTNQNEDGYREELKKHLLLIFQEHENLQKQQEFERAKREDEERKQKEWARAREEELRKEEAQNTRGYYNSTHSIPYTGRIQKQMNSDLKRDREFLNRKNPTEYPHWYKKAVQHLAKYYDVEGEVNQEVIRPVNLSSEYEQNEKTKNKLISRLPAWKIDEILNYYVNGEAYFTGNPRQWKEIVLNSYELLYHNKISISQLLQIIKEQGIEFKQTDKTMTYPINDYIQFVSKKIKREIKF